MGGRRVDPAERSWEGRKEALAALSILGITLTRGNRGLGTKAQHRLQWNLVISWKVGQLTVISCSVLAVGYS
jgi:hypothetical protein